MRTDIYAVGVMLYELVTGKLPFEAENIGDVLIKQINQPAPRLDDSFQATEIGQALDAIIQTCLAKNPADRGLSAAQLAWMFHQLASGAAGAARQICRSHGLRLRRRRTNRVRAIVPVAVAAGLVALLVGNHTASELTHARRPAAAAAVAAVAAPRTVLAETPAPACPAVSTKLELPGPGSSKRLARATGRLGRAITLDPYR